MSQIFWLIAAWTWFQQSLLTSCYTSGLYKNHTEMDDGMSLPVERYIPRKFSGPLRKESWSPSQESRLLTTEVKSIFQSDYTSLMLHSFMLYLDIKVLE